MKRVDKINCMTEKVNCLTEKISLNVVSANKIRYK